MGPSLDAEALYEENIDEDAYEKVLSHFQISLSDLNTYIAFFNPPPFHSFTIQHLESNSKSFHLTISPKKLQCDFFHLLPHWLQVFTTNRKQRMWQMPAGRGKNMTNTLCHVHWTQAE